MCRSIVEALVLCADPLLRSSGASLMCTPPTPGPKVPISSPTTFSSIQFSSSSTTRLCCVLSSFFDHHIQSSTTEKAESRPTVAVPPRQRKQANCRRTAIASRWRRMTGTGRKRRAVSIMVACRHQATDACALDGRAVSSMVAGK